MKLTTRNAAQAIANHANFSTNGALSGEQVNGLSVWSDAGRLQGEDREQFVKDAAQITYVVRSYATPIAWVVNGNAYKVKQRFSNTTSRHQGQLHML